MFLQYVANLFLQFFFIFIFYFRKASLSLIKKMIHYIQPDLLMETCSLESPTYNFGATLTEVIATVLDNEVGSNIIHLHVFLFFLDIML